MIDEGWNGADRLAAGQQRPVARHPDRDAETGGAAGEATDQGKHPDRGHRIADGIVQFVIRRGGVDGQVLVSGRLEFADCRARRVNVVERSGARRAPRWPSVPSLGTAPRRGIGIISLIS